MEINDPKLTVEGVMVYLQEHFGWDVMMLGSGKVNLFSAFSNDRKKMAERKAMVVRQALENVTGKVIPDSQKYIVLEVMVTDAGSGEDFDVPHIRFRV